MNTLKKLNYNQIIFDFKLTRYDTGKASIDEPPMTSKKYDFLPVEWEALEKSNIRNTIIKDDKKIKLNGYALLTGVKTGLTVIDFDIECVYNKFILQYPEFKNCLRVKTFKGYHCYFKYNPLIKSGSNILKNVDIIGVDVRNDNAFITIPPTKYIDNDREYLNTKYEEIEGEVKDFSEEFLKLYQTAKKKPSKKINKIVEEETEEIDNEELYKDVDLICSKLDEDRYDNYSEWIEWALLLKNLDLDEDQQEELFIKYSSLSNKFNEDKDLEMFRKIDKKPDGLTFKTLCYWFKEDDSEEFKKWQISKITQKNNDNLNFFHYPIARDFTSGEISDYFKVMYGDIFVYSNSNLYYYNGIFWEIDNLNNSYLSNFIDDNFYNHFLDIHKENQNKLHKFTMKNKNDEKIKKLDDILDDYYKKIRSNFKKITFRKSLIEDIKNKLNRNNQQFDQNPNLFCFKNKLYDLKNRKFIDPKPSYYITMTAGYNYNDDEKLKSLNIAELKKIIDTIFNEDLKKSYLSVLSSGLIGEQVQKFIVASGCGGNGKSLINKIFMETIGQYGYKLSPQILQQKLKIAACPELANLNLKRFILTSEPDAEGEIKCSVLKQLTGDDEINARALYSDQTKTGIFSTLVMETNDRPRLDEVNQSILRRIFNVPFNSKFVDEYTYNNYTEQERKENKIYLGNSDYEKREFKNKYKQALFDLLVNEHLEDYNKNGLYKCKEVINESNKYLSDSDIVLNFVNENYEETNDKKKFIKCVELWDKFKTSDEYLKMNKVSQRKLNKTEFIKRLETNLFIGKFIKIKDKVLVLYGYIKKEEEDEEDDDNTKSALDI
jgi:hypothetical protein